MEKEFSDERTKSKVAKLNSEKLINYHFNMKQNAIRKLRQVLREEPQKG